MRIYYPRSFTGLLCMGFTLVSVPLMAALVNNAVSIDQIVNRSQLAVYQAVKATQNSRRLAELLTALERNARQMLIMGDRSLLDAYVLNRQQLLQVAAEFTAPPFDRAQMQALNEIVAGEAVIYKVLSDAGSKPAQLQNAADRFGELGERGRIITLHSNEMIEREVRAMRATAATAQRITLWQMLALIPIVVFLAVGFAILTTRPIRQIDAAIRDLGGGHLDKPVAVAGPLDLQYLGERLEWMRGKLLEVEEQKKRFLQQVSHELKTPLTALREGTELLADGAVGTLTPGQREVTDILHHQSLKLQKLIEDLLSYSTSLVHSGRLGHAGALALTAVSLRQLVQRVVEDQKLALHARNLSLHTEVEDVSVVGDFDKLRTLLDNLLSNAIKFSPPGGSVAICARRRDAHIELSVTDKGPGIAAEDRAHVFEPLYQGGVAANGLVKGTGMGLFIARSMAEAHGGSIVIDDTEVGANGDGNESRTCTGARLRVRLPLSLREAQTA